MGLGFNRRRIEQFCRWLALCLLVAQLGADIHLSSHLLADPVDRLGARSCGTCLASSQLQQAMAATPPVMADRIVAWVATVSVAPVAAVRAAPFRSFRSRAPPALA